MLAQDELEKLDAAAGRLGDTIERIKRIWRERQKFEAEHSQWGSYLTRTGK